MESKPSVAPNQRAVILLSGGMDSATVLAWAVNQGYECVTLSVDYGQLYAAELKAAGQLSKTLGAREHRTVSLDLNQFGGSALTDPNLPIPTTLSTDIPSTYVPARNTILLSLGLALAEVSEADTIMIGINSVDFSGYPDCRGEFIEAYERLANLATKRSLESPFRILALLVTLSKADILRLGTQLGVNYAETISCYQATEDGMACGQCDACRLRKRGFEEANLPDVTRYVSNP